MEIFDVPTLIKLVNMSISNYYGINSSNMMENYTPKNITGPDGKTVIIKPVMLTASYIKNPYDFGLAYIYEITEDNREIFSDPAALKVKQLFITQL